MRLEQRGRSGRPGSELTILATRIFGAGEETLTEVDAQQPFGIEIRFKMHRPVGRPAFSIGILNATGVVCVWNVSEEDGLHCEAVAGLMCLRVWYADHKLSPGAYEVNFALREHTSYETLERLGGIAAFSVTGRGRARGIMALSAQWDLHAERGEI